MNLIIFEGDYNHFIEEGVIMKKRTFLSDDDLTLFKEGNHCSLYQQLGPHPANMGKQEGIHFAVWAPNAESVSLVGNFNTWDIEADIMTPVGDSGVFELFTAKTELGDIYKYAIKTRKRSLIYKSDPYAGGSEKLPGSASVITDFNHYKWTDKNWMNRRKRASLKEIPVSIYQVFPGSWRKHRDERGSWDLSYMELAEELCRYVKKMGYTHIQLMSLAAHPVGTCFTSDVTGYYAPTSRYGTPEEFAGMVNYLHNNGIGVILDWCASGFSKAIHGLSNFDGTPLYEYSDPLKMEIANHHLRIFDYSKPQVRSFLISNALYWMDIYHIDGLSISGVGSMLYLDYDKQNVSHAVNPDGSNVNKDAESFLKELNQIVKKTYPGVMMISDEETAFNDITSDEGLGFTYKRRKKYMHNFLEYLKYDPYFRQFDHKIVTDEGNTDTKDAMLVGIGHDEILLGNGSLYSKATIASTDNRSAKLALLKAAYAFIYGLPGKKMIFMGQDFAQPEDCIEAGQLDWFVQSIKPHKSLQSFVADLNTLYRKFGCLYNDVNADSRFIWMNKHDNARSILSFVRTAPKAGTNLLFIVNFTPVDYPNYAVGVPKKGKYTLLLDSWEGTGHYERELQSKAEVCDNQPYRLEYNLPAYGVAIFKY